LSLASLAGARIPHAASVIEGLLYVDFSNDLPNDLTSSPATPVVGSIAVIENNAFYSLSPFYSDPDSLVQWSAPKFAAVATEGFILEADVTWATIANSAFRRIVSLQSAALSPTDHFDLGFYQAAGKVYFGYEAMQLITSVDTTPNIKHRVAMVRPPDTPTATVSFYVDHVLIGTTPDIGVALTDSIVLIGNGGNQGTEDYFISLVWMRPWEPYT
jgi:hypothetical protein